MLKISLDLLSYASSVQNLFKPREPKLFFVQKAPEFSAFKQYIRSEGELKRELHALDYVEVSLDGIVELFGKYNKVVDDNVIPSILIDELYAIREYDRDKFEKNWNGSKTRQEYEAQEAHIAKHGFPSNEFGLVHLYRKDENTVAAYLGEGNNRVTIAKKRGNPLRMPVLIMYNRG
jgi:hypothetical protein